MATNLQNGGGPATPPGQIVPARASAQDVTRYKSLATDVLRLCVVDIALSGSFGIRIGALQLQFSYWQSQNVPCCDLVYARQHNASTSACNNPPTDMVKGDDMLTNRPTPAPINASSLL